VNYSKLQKEAVKEIADSPEKKKLLHDFVIRAMFWQEGKKKLFKDSWLRTYLKS
jgi:hypothetical protein